MIRGQDNERQKNMNVNVNRFVIKIIAFSKQFKLTKTNKMEETDISRSESEVQEIYYWFAAIQFTQLSAMNLGFIENDSRNIEVVYLPDKMMLRFCRFMAVALTQE